ncbi:MAG: FIST signal transduction protein [Acidimicrobiia bacterium]
MKTATVTYDRVHGWSGPLPALDSPSTLVLVFAAADYFDHPAPFADLSAAYPSSVVVGCSGAGGVLGDRVLDDHVVVAVSSFDNTVLRSAMAVIEDPLESRMAGATIAKQLVAPDLVGVLVLSEGLLVNGSELARGLTSNLGTSVVITGGLAADPARFERTWVLAGGVPTVGAVSAVGFYGDAVQVGYGFKGGWDIFGPQRRVTRSTGNVVYELDGEPALDLYERYLGELASELPASGLLFPLAVWSEDPADQVVRTLLAIDRQARSIVFAGDVEEGSWAQLMQANFDRLVEGAEGAATMATFGVQPGCESLAVAVSCVGRKLVLGERVEDEVEAAHSVLAPGATQIGFYSFGELSPSGLGRCDLHNQTMTITAISER